MHRLRLIAVLLLAVSGCSAGRVINLPSVPTDPAASLTILRNRNAVGACCTVKVSLDGTLVARLGTGEYLTLPVAAGLRSVTAHNASFALTLDAGRSYYVLVTVLPGGAGFEMETVPDSTARRLMTSYRALRR